MVQLHVREVSKSMALVMGLPVAPGSLLQHIESSRNDSSVGISQLSE